MLPDRDDMRKHMDSLIHHFLIVAEGFNVPEGEVYHADRGVEGRTRRLYEVERRTETGTRSFPRTELCESLGASGYGEGEMIADVVAIIGSLDIVFGEIDR